MAVPSKDVVFATKFIDQFGEGVGSAGMFGPDQLPGLHGSGPTQFSRLVKTLVVDAGFRHDTWRSGRVARHRTDKDLQYSPVFVHNSLLELGHPIRSLPPAPDTEEAWLRHDLLTMTFK